NVINQTLTASRNLPGWQYVWTSPSVSPTVLSGAYFLLDGDRMIVVQLQIQPPSDTNSFYALTPIWNHIGQSLTSFYPIPSASAPTSTGIAAPTSTASP
ncbi:MAG TPA: hypothetical protein VKY26_05315, partial [Actinomycetota bacterium]|nr:hypothetical protein [Actinomycetota bacterium]